MVDSVRREGAVTFARIRELQRDPVQGKFDIVHLREIHYRIFQDLPHHGPGEFRPDAPGHFKHRRLEESGAYIVVPYALRFEIDRQLAPVLAALKGGKTLAGLDMLEMSEAIAQIYARLDFLHPFREGNSRTLRCFTAQLAQANGYSLDWGTTNVTPRSRDALYIARDLAVIQLRYPGLTADKAMMVESREEYEMALQLERYQRYDSLQKIILRSLNRDHDSETEI